MFNDGFSETLTDVNQQEASSSRLVVQTQRSWDEPQTSPLQLAAGKLEVSWTSIELGRAWSPEGETEKRQWRKSLLEKRDSRQVPHRSL